jgi:hypothetical protein
VQATATCWKQTEKLSFLLTLTLTLTLALSLFLHRGSLPQNAGCPFWLPATRDRVVRRFQPHLGPQFRPEGIGRASVTGRKQQLGLHRAAGSHQLDRRCVGIEIEIVGREVELEETRFCHEESSVTPGGAFPLVAESGRKTMVS